MNDFLSLGDVNRKRDFISKLLDEVNSKYCYKKENSTRTKNYSYHFIVNGNKVRVCKTMFTDTFCVSPTYLKTVKNKTTPTGVISEYLRGKHMKQRKIHPLIVQSIHDHINSFARIESHYCRADNPREFIDGDLTISEMYRLYKIYCTEKGWFSMQKNINMKKYSIQNTTLVFLFLRKINVLFVPGSKTVQKKKICYEKKILKLT